MASDAGVEVLAEKEQALCPAEKLAFDRPQRIAALTELLDSLRMDINGLLVRTRNAGTLSAKNRGGAPTEREIACADLRLRNFLENVTRWVNRPILDAKGQEQFGPARANLINQARLDRGNLIAQGYHLLITWAQILAYRGQAVDSENPLLSDGRTYGIQILKERLEEALTYSPLYSKPTFHNVSAPYAPRSYGAEQLRDATSVFEFQEDPFDPTMVWVRPQRATLANIAMNARLNTPTEMNYMRWTRDLVLLALAESISEHAYLLGGERELAQWKAKLESVIRYQGLDDAIASRLIGLVGDKARAIRQELWVANTLNGFVAQLKQTPAFRIPEYQKTRGADRGWNKLVESVHSALKVAGTQETMSVPALREFLMQRTLLWFSEAVTDKPSREGIEAFQEFTGIDKDPTQTPPIEIFAYTKAEALRRARRALDSWNWNLVLRSYDFRTPNAILEDQRLADRAEFDAAYFKMAREHHPLWQATQSRWLGLRKSLPVPQEFARQPVSLPFLKEALAPRLNAIALSGVAHKRTLGSELWDNHSENAYGAARRTFDTALQQFKYVQQHKDGGLQTRERKQINADIEAIQKLLPILGFDRTDLSDRPSLADLKLSDAEIKSYVHAYLAYHWNLFTLLSPDATKRADLGNILEKLAEAKSVTEAHHILTPALERRLQSAIDSFTKVASAQKPEELADFMAVSSHVKDTLEATVPGMKSLIQMWAKKHIAEDTKSLWQHASTEFSTPMHFFFYMMVAEFGARLILPPVAGLATRVGFGPRIVSVLSPHNGFVRAMSGFHATAARYFQSYFAAFLGVIAVDVVRHWDQTLDYLADNAAMSDAFLAQSDGNVLYTLTQVEKRQAAADGAVRSFLIGDVAFNAGLFLLGPISQKIKDLWTVHAERQTMRHWNALGLDSVEVQGKARLWDAETIQELAEERIAAEKAAALSPESLQKRIARIQKARNELLRIRARDEKNYQVALRAFTDVFRNDLRMKPSFNNADIDSAFADRIRQIAQEIELGSKTKSANPVKIHQLRLEAEAAERGRDALLAFAESYGRMLSVGPFARFMQKGRTRVQTREELAYQQDLAENTARIFGQDIQAARDAARAKFTARFKDDTHSVEVSSREIDAFSRAVSDAEIDSYALALTRSREGRGQSVYNFWTSGSAPRVRTNNAFVWYFRSEPRDRSTGFDLNKNYYSILGANPRASIQEISVNFHRLMNLHETGQAAKAPLQLPSVKELEEAHALLSDPALRASYDVALISRETWIQTPGAKSAAKATQTAIDSLAREDAKVRVQEWKTPPTVKMLPAGKEAYPIPNKGADPLELAHRDAFMQEYQSGHLEKDYYAILGVPETADRRDLTAALVRVGNEVGFSKPPREVVEKMRLLDGAIDLADRKQYLEPYAKAQARFEEAKVAHELLNDPVFRTYYDIVRAHRAGLMEGAQ